MAKTKTLTSPYRSSGRPRNDAASAVVELRRNQADPPRTDSQESLTSQPAVGRLVKVDELGRVWVALRGFERPLQARLGLQTNRRKIETAITTGQAALVVFENGERDRPIITALVEDRLSAPAESDGNLLAVEADSDGRRVQITAKEEIILRCGKATLSLMQNGRVVVRGAHVETHATGTNRIKGGAVRIN